MKAFRKILLIASVLLAIPAAALWWLQSVFEEKIEITVHNHSASPAKVSMMVMDLDLNREHEMEIEELSSVNPGSSTTARFRIDGTAPEACRKIFVMLDGKKREYPCGERIAEGNKGLTRAKIVIEP